MDRDKQFSKAIAWDNDLLWRYLKGELPEKESRLLQSEINQDPFLKDAIEGLMPEGQNEQAVRNSVLLLQLQLKRQIHNRKRRKYSVLKPKLWLWVSVLALILFIFIAWWMITFIAR